MRELDKSLYSILDEKHPSEDGDNYSESIFEKLFGFLAPTVIVAIIIVAAVVVVFSSSNIIVFCAPLGCQL